ncbi:probable histone-lysine N-methyltransferase set-23 [Thrips palmi]|uniref:Probable histone-lysine N-methyltransferase set-23 n=1 Tax=Thrips palmi TaxID=161013 RepID=A0A6P8ZNW2_THRPL|nr:probable histone-lysine N-methyltransferase set-23 [Thrips palmi]
MDLTDDDCVLVDEYDHVLPHLVYAPTSVPGKGANIEEFESQLQGCKCYGDDVCALSSSCTNAHVCSQNYSSDGTILAHKWVSGSIVECNSQCTCSVKKCGNRVVQFGPRKNLSVFMTGPEKGYGLKTTELIPKGEFICEYAGEVIGMDEAKIRFKAASMKGEMNYIFVLREFVDSEKKTVTETIIDPSVIGNIGRYINHSCNPNAGIVPVRVDSPVPVLGIFARRNISAGDEITYDYSGSYNMLSDVSSVNSFSSKPCRCGSQDCSGSLPFDTSLV